MAIPLDAEGDTPEPESQARVVVLHSYHYGFSWSDSISRGIRSVFDEDPFAAELRFEFMDTRRIFSDAYFERFAEMLRIKYEGKSVDVVICADDHALNFMLSRGEAVFPDVPIVFCSVSGYRPEMREDRQITGLRESIAIRETLQLALQLHPQTKKVAVLTDASRTGQALKVKAVDAFEPFADKLEIRYVEDKTVDKLQQEVTTYSSDTIVFLFIFSGDRKGRVFSHEQNLDRLIDYCPVPIYAVWDFYLGHGIVGGLLADGELEGRMAAGLAQRILNGEKAAAIHLGQSPTRYKFDWRQLDRFGVGEERLPENSIIINRPFSFYQTYQLLIWATATVFTVLVGLIAALIANIVRRKRVEIAVRSSERRLRAVFEAANNVSFIITDTNDPEPTVLEMSPGAERIFGYPRAEIVGQRVGRLHLPEDVAGFPDLHRRMREGKAGFDVETTLVRKNGERFPAWLSTYPLFNDAGRMHAVLCVCIDISDRKQAEEARKKLEVQLLHAQRMEVVGQLAGGVAHDFNNLLQVILSYGDLARKDIQKDSAVFESLQEIMKAGHRAELLVSQLLAFSSRQVLEMEDLDLNEVIADLIKMIQRLIGEHIELEVVPGHGLGTVCADRGQIGQILTNLCINARDAMQAGGTITIETEDVRIDKVFCESHAWARPGRYALMSVSDTGCGMDSDTISRIFEPFFTTKEVGKGTGLGLSTVYGLVRQHEGLVHVYSEVGEGSMFKIYLPVVERAARTVEEKTVSSVQAGTGTVLLAEDEEMVRTLCKSILDKAGYNVIAVADGHEALSVFEEHADTIDLAILDVVMPKLGGRAVYERMRELKPDVRVLFSSGYSMNGIHTNFLLDEGLALLPKPYHPEDLLRKVHEILDQDTSLRRGLR